ncbi:MAG TPA: acyltransferase [Syntrophobacteraceae bacterium]|nr:acyltransferase [Syntrophobacteraceae bacterium]
MVESWSDKVRGVFSLVVVVLNTIFWPSLLFLVALLKLAVPVDGWRIACGRLLNAIGQCWIGCNNLGLRLTKEIRWKVEGTDGLSPNDWYLVVANHQTWVDIIVLQKILHRKIPMLKFFLKRELIWVPILGIAWWALDFPFMRRTSSVQKDFETTREACEKFKRIPVSVMNFLEGTRFTREKQEKQKSPYKHLLKPKSGGIALVLGTMGNQLRSILDVTIVYPDGVQDIWAFLCSQSMTIEVRVRQLPVSRELIGDFLADREFRRRFNSWLNTLWAEKDQLIETLLQTPAH